MKRFAILAILLFFTLTTPALAYNYKVTPRIIDRDVKPRDIFTETISITNNEHYNLKIYPSVNAVDIDEGGDISEFVSPSVADGKNTITSWLAISRKALAIAPGETKEISLHIKLHPEAEPGVYHAVIGFGSGTNRPEAEKKVANGLAPQVILTLKVDQDKQEFLKLSRFNVERFVTDAENGAIQYTLDNPGDTDVVPTGEIIFYDGRGNEVASIPVNPNKDSLTPGQETTYVASAPISDMLGKYKAFLSVDYGTTQVASVYDTAFFYVFPWQKLLIVFALVLLVAIIVTVVLHRRYKGIEGSEYDADEVPLFVRDGVSKEVHHDINLKAK